MPRLRQILPGLVISGALLFWVFRELQWETLVACYAGIDIPLLLVSASLFVPMQLFRLGRWVFLTSPLGVVSFRDQLRISIVGNALTILLPLRLGEFSRPAMLKSVSGVPISSGLGVTALERVLDGLLVTGAFWALIPFMPIEATENSVVFGAAIGSGIVFVSAALALTGMAMRPRWIRAIGENTLGRVAPRVWSKIWLMMEAFVTGLRVLQGPQNILAGVAAPLILCVLVFAIMIPSAPGFLGTYQAALVLGLSLFGYPAVQSANFAMVLYPLNIGLMVGMALPYVSGWSEVMAQTRRAFKFS